MARRWSGPGYNLGVTMWQRLRRGMVDGQAKDGLRRAPSERVRGLPTSSNGASSMHLRWDWGEAEPELVEMSATLTVVQAPVVPRLHFWALQVGFADAPTEGAGRHGAGHVGLQWHPAHPGSRAANWGGYAVGGGELGGTRSGLASATGNVNTRDLRWESGRPHRLTVRRGIEGWAGLVDEVVVRELHAPGSRLVGAVVWSEVFSRCDDPSVVVRWADLSGVGADGGVVHPRAVSLSYQSVADGGCSNTSSEPDGQRGVVQRTNSARAHPAGTLLPIGTPRH